jgi:hypothetical protein
MDGLMSERRIFTVPNPDGEGRVRASFAGFAPDQPETIDDLNVVGGKRKVDRIWVRYEEGERADTTGLVRRSDIEPRLD